MENKIFLGKYRILTDQTGMPAELRRSSGGVTCQAQEIGSGRDIALELVPAASLKTEMHEQVEAEALAAKQLSHINIPILYDFGFEDDDLVYVTEYFDGITTEAWVTAHGPMPVRAVLHIALQVVSALGAATFHLIVHRAIHPGNLLIVPGQTAEGDWPLIKVLNFGRILTNFRKTEETNARNKFAPFASPEQLEHGTVDFRSEIYSLGCTLWSLLTGVSPFNAPGKPVAAAQMAPAMKRFRGVPKKIGRLIAEMVSINPDERPLDPVVMTQQLQECLLHVERREAITRRFGIPATWQRRRVARPARRLLLRPIAVAALLITATLLATLFLPERFRPDALWQRMTRREPIGIPIGIREATTKPVVAQQRSAAKPNETQPLTSATSSMSSEAAANRTANDANAVPVATASSIVASANQNNATRSQTESPSSSREAQVEQPAVAASNVPATEDAESVHEQAAGATTKSIEPAQVAQSPANEESNLSPAEIAATTTKTQESDQTKRSAAVATNNVPAAEDSESVREQSGAATIERAEPPPPTEGPDDASSTARQTTASKSHHKTKVVKSPSELRKRVSKRIRLAKVRTERDGATVQLPGGMVHARFVGTTPDGRWMLALPSHRVMVVPPPPDFIPR